MLKARAEEAKCRAAAAEQGAAELARKNVDLESRCEQRCAEAEEERRCT